jgi:integrase
MRKTLTDKGVAALKPRAGRFAYPDPELRGHYVRVTPNGAKSFVAVTLGPHGKQVWATIGPTDRYSIEAARELAREAIKRVHAGLPAFDVPPPKPATFKDVAEQWLARHVHASGLRSVAQITRHLQTHIYPAWANRVFLDIRRSDVAALLDQVQDNHGARAADYVLAITRGIMNWFATRNDDFTPPIVRGMQRRSQYEKARARILGDDEIRRIWTAADTAGSFGSIVKLCLLTAQRSRKVAAIKCADISEDGVWSIPAAPREKATAGALKLSAAALAIIRAQPKLGDNPHVFAGRYRNGPFGSFGPAMMKFRTKLPGMPPWTVHDLRRTARSLMSRAGVRPDIAERVLGHAIPGIRGVYDRHSFFSEKADALKRLAVLVDGIVSPSDNVPATKRRRKRADDKIADAGHRHYGD